LAIPLSVDSGVDGTQTFMLVVEDIYSRPGRRWLRLHIDPEEELKVKSIIIANGYSTYMNPLYATVDWPPVPQSDVDDATIATPLWLSRSVKSNPRYEDDVWPLP